MNIFSDELRKRYPQLDYPAVEEALDRGSGARIEVSRASDVSPVAKVPFKVRALFQIGLRRNMELAASFVDSFNSALFVPLFVTGRAILETGCLLFEVWLRVERILKQQDKAALVEFDDRVIKHLFGVKSPAWGGDPENYPAPNVLTIIDRLNKATPGLRRFYDALSELAHPNYAGMHAAYCRVDPEAGETRYVDRPFGEDVQRLDPAINAVAVGLQMAVYAVEFYERELPAFTRLCEEEIHDSGTWPPDVPYPRA